MNGDLALRGVWVTFSSDGPGEIEGWLIGEIPQGSLISLDDELTHIRLVERGTWLMASYDHRKRLSKLAYDNSTELEQRLHDVNVDLSRQLRSVLSKVRYDKLQMFCRASFKIASEIRRGEAQAYENMRNQDFGYAEDELVNFFIAQVDRSTAMHAEVYEMFEDCGLSDVLDEFGGELSVFPAELVIPAHDLEFEAKDELVSAFESTKDENWTSTKHRNFLKAATDARYEFLHLHSKKDNYIDGAQKESDDSTSLSRWIGPSLRILAGTGLTAANAALGVTAGLTTTIATIGATAVPTYVGVATSLYTGLAQVSEGLEKIGRRK